MQFWPLATILLAFLGELGLSQRAIDCLSADAVLDGSLSAQGWPSAFQDFGAELAVVAERYRALFKSTSF